MTKDKYSVNIPHIKDSSIMNGTVIETNSTRPFLLKNFTNSSRNPTLPVDRFGAMKTVILSLQILVVLVGSVGNAFVCIITSRKRSLQIVGNRFILNLAIADLGILLIFYPHHLSKEFSLSWPFGEFVCKTFGPFTEIFYGVGIGSITAIAFHRYRMLVYCMKQQMNLQTTKRVMFLIWLLSFIILVMPKFFVMELKDIPKIRVWICQERWPNQLSKKMYEGTVVLAFYVCPLVFISLTYYRIRTKLRDNIRRHDSYKRASLRAKSSAEVISRIGQNQRALRLLAPVVIFFAVCMAPISFITLLSLFLKNPGKTFSSLKYMPDIQRISILLLNMNSSVNPIIYSIVNTEFRREFTRLLRCAKTRSCCADTTQGLSLSTFRKSTSIDKSRSKWGSFLLNKRGSSSSARKSPGSARNSAEKVFGKEAEKQVGDAVELAQKVSRQMVEENSK